MKQVIVALWNHRTKLIGFIQVTVGVLATGTGIFSPKTLAWYVLLNGLLTAYVGLFNSWKQDQPPHNPPEA